MGSAWSVFAVPVSEIGRLKAALLAIDREEYPLEDARLTVGAALSPVPGGEAWVPFGILHNAYRYYEYASDDDLPESFFAAFSRVVSLYGTSNTDGQLVTQYAGGDVVQQWDTLMGMTLYPLVHRLGFDVVSMSTWGDFGISGAELSGQDHAFDDGLPNFDPAAFTAEPLAPELPMQESTDQLIARANSGNAEDVARACLAAIYRGVDNYDFDLYRLEEVVNDLPDGDVKRAADQLFAMREN